MADRAARSGKSHVVTPRIVTPLIVTLDGPAGVGKTSLAKRLARTLGVAYLDTGAMFRAVAHALGEGAWDWPEAKLEAALADMAFTLAGSGAESRLALNGRVIGDEVRTEQVGMWGSNVARLPVVREHLKRAQQALGEACVGGGKGSCPGLVAEGRDMGTVVFPDAAVKFFLDATPEARAERRYKQLKAMGQAADLAELTESIRARDDQDRTRAAAPLRPADDAVIVDTTDITEAEVFEALLDGINRRRARG